MTSAIHENPVQSNHPLIMNDTFLTVEEYALHLIHQKAYENAAALCQGRAVLDWGCNNGYGLPLLKKTALRVGGLDTNIKCVEEACRRHPEFANDIRLYDGQNIPFPERNWDVVVSFQVIEHVQNMSAYLQAIKGVLSDAGVVLFTTPNREIRLDPGMKPWNEFHVTEFTAAELKKTLQQHFRYVEVYGLQGDTDLTDIERNRCALARLSARTPGAASKRMLHHLSGGIKAAIRPVVPKSVIASLRNRLRPTLSEPGASPIPNAGMGRFSTAQLHYSQSSMETAVDLLAVCSNAEIAPSTCPTGWTPVH